MARLNSPDPRSPNLSNSAVRVVGGQILEADGAAAGVYTFDVKVPAYAVLLEALVHNEAVWGAGTTATLIAGTYADSSGAIGSAIDDDAIFTSTSVKATDLTAGQSIGFNRVGGVGGALLTEGSSSHFLNAVETVDRWIRFKITTVGTVGTTGRTYVYVVYAIPEMDVASYVAS